jgi:outer membrane protein assembly factor BamB
VPPVGMGCERISQRKTVLAVASFLAAAALLCACGKHEATSSDSPGISEIAKKWEFTTGGIISGGLALAEDGSLYVACEDGFVYALDPNGKLLWKMYIGPTESTPVVVSDGSVLVSNKHGRLFALNHSGDVRWQTDLYDGNTLNKNAGALGREYFYVPSRGNLSSARLTNGQVDWQSGWGGDQWGSVTLMPDGNLLSPGRGRLTALDSSGRVAWQYPPLSPEAIQRNGGFALTPASFFVSSDIAVDADRHMYAGIGRTKFVAMGPDGSIKWEVKMDRKTQGSEINRSFAGDRRRRHDLFRQLRFDSVRGRFVWHHEMEVPTARTGSSHSAAHTRRLDLCRHRSFPFRRFPDRRINRAGRSG